MCATSATVVVALLLAQACLCEYDARGPPRVDKPVLLDSFIPASMQIIAYYTELMKYELKPTAKPPPSQGGAGASWTTTTSTMRPTPSHRPGIYAPAKPPGPAAYYQKDFNYRDYVERLQQPSGLNYFDRYRFPLEDEQQDDAHPVGRSREPLGRSDRLSDELVTDYELYFGKGVADILALVRRVEPEGVPNDIDAQAEEFARIYDDTTLRFEQFRQKKVPPTKAYVTLLSLYDLLNKESKKLGLNKYQGYSDKVLQELARSSMGSSAYQLKTVLSKIVERGDTRKPDIVKKLKQLVTDLDEPHSYINEALKDIPALPFVL